MHDPLREQAAAPNPSEAAPASVGRPTDSLLAAVAGTAAHIPAGMVGNLPVEGILDVHHTHTFAAGRAAGNSAAFPVPPLAHRPPLLVALGPCHTWGEAGTEVALRSWLLFGWRRTVLPFARWAGMPAYRLAQGRPFRRAGSRRMCVRAAS